LIVAVLVFQGPLADLWFQSRQQHLASDLGAKRGTAHKGQALAVLQIPRINLDLVVVEGDGPVELRGGPGHRSSSPRPGEVGNSLIFGHRSGWGAPFSKLNQLQVKDEIVVKKRNDNSPLLFQVVSISRLPAADPKPYAPSSDRRVTLVTSTGGRFSTSRLVVSAVSGEAGALSPPNDVRAGLTYGSKVFNAMVGILVLLVVALVGVLRVLRRRHRPAAVAIVAVPLALTALVALLLELDLLLLPPLH
jgi:sortase A